MTENKNSKPETVAWEFKEGEAENHEVDFDHPTRENYYHLVKDVYALIRRRDAKKYYKNEKNECYKAGYKNGKRQGKKDVLELIEEIESKISFEKYFGQKGDSGDKQKALSKFEKELKTLKQKLKGDIDGNE